MNIAIHKSSWRFKSGSLVYGSDPLTRRRRKETKIEGMRMLKHPWNHINESSSEDSGTNCGRKGGVRLFGDGQRNNKMKDKTWIGILSSEASNSCCDALVSEENKRGWEKWASRCDSLFLRPPWHHLLTAGMCSIIFINIGSSHSWQI